MASIASTFLRGTGILDQLTSSMNEQEIVADIERQRKAGKSYAQIMFDAIDENAAGMVEVLSRSFRRELPIDHRDATGSFLHRAARRGSIEMVKALVERGGIDVAILDRKGRSAYEIVTQPGQPNGPPRPLDRDRRNVHDYLSSALRSQVDSALGKSPPQTSRLVDLLSAGAQTDERLKRAVDDAGRTVLHHAVRTDDPILVDRLIMSGVDPAALDGHAESALHLARRYNAGQAVRTLTKYLSQELFESKDARRNVALIAAGADVRAEKNGSTLLMRKAETGDTQMIRIILDAIPKGERKSHLEERDPGGRTALHLAANEGWFEAYRTLKDAGADESTRDNAGRAPLSKKGEGYDVDDQAGSGKADVMEFYMRRLINALSSKFRDHLSKWPLDVRIAKEDGTWVAGNASPDRWIRVEEGALGDDDVINHEFGHAVHFRMNPDDRAAVKRFFNERKDWVSDYARTNDLEYFAESVRAFFNRPIQGSNLNRRWLHDNDRGMFDLIRTIFTDMPKPLV